MRVGRCPGVQLHCLGTCKDRHLEISAYAHQSARIPSFLIGNARPGIPERVKYGHGSGYALTSVVMGDANTR